MKKLTDKQVKEIKEIYGKKELEKIAKDYNVSITTIRYWGDDNYREKNNERKIKRYKSLSKEQRRLNYLKYRDYQKNYRRNRYATNESFREKIKEMSREYNRRKRQCKNSKRSFMSNK